MPAHSKYKKAFAKQLLKGLRRDGLSIEEVCQQWDIDPKTYSAWRLAHPEFEEAHRIGDRDMKAWLHKTHRAVSSGQQAGNASCLNFAMKNQAGWVDKTEVHTTHEEQVHVLRIERLPSYTTTRVIEHEGTNNKLDEQPS